MTGPYKPPGRLGPAAGSPAPQRPGMVPIPPERAQQRRRGAIPGGAPLTLPQRPAETTGDDSEQVSPQTRWAYHFQGNAGARDSVTAFKPVIELPEARPLAVQFYADPSVPQPAQAAPESRTDAYIYDATLGDGGQLDGQLRFDSAGQTDATQVYLAVEHSGYIPGDPTVKDWFDAHTAVELEVQYESSWFRFSVDSIELTDDGGVAVLYIEVTPLADDIDPGDGPIDNMQAVNVQLTGVPLPNAGARARVRYRAGKSEVTFDCDWAGGFLVYADRFELSRVTFPLEASIDYEDGPIEIAASVMADAPRPAATLALTVQPQLVGVDESIEIPVHPFARRVNLLAKYGNAGAPGDAPLGQFFLAWLNKLNLSLGYIDAMSAREALFGPGLPVPFGVDTLVLTNRSADASVRLGVIWRLEL